MLWLVLQPKAYAQYDAFLKQETSVIKARNVKLDFVKRDTKREQVIYFHGNTNTVGSTRHTEASGSIPAHEPKRMQLLSFNYRGFGRPAGQICDVQHEGFVGAVVGPLQG